MRIFVGCSSSENIDEAYKKDCRELLLEVLKDNDLVFGAYNKSLMGIAYEIAKKNNRKVIGMCPEVYKDSLKDLECDEEVITKSIVESTFKIFENSDFMLVLPGGFGSIFEFFTANYCEICKEVNIPIIIYNSCGYYDKLLSFIEDAHNEAFIKDSDLGHFKVANTIEEVLSYINK